MDQPTTMGFGAHGKAYLTQAIGRNPMATAIILGVLIILLVILIFVAWNFRSKYERCASKPGCSGYTSGPLLSRSNNLVNGSNNPLWWWGSADAGLYGSVGRPSTRYHVGTWDPAWREPRRGPVVRSPSQENLAGGLGMGPTMPGSCPPEFIKGPDGACYWRHNEDNAPVTPLDTTQCARKLADWDPAATAEAQALGQVGALQHQDYGERNLLGAVNLAFDSTAPGLSNNQLEGLMYTGGV